MHSANFGALVAFFVVVGMKCQNKNTSIGGRLGYCLIDRILVICSYRGLALFSQFTHLRHKTWPFRSQHTIALYDEAA